MKDIASWNFNMAGIRSVNISLCRGRFWLSDWLGRDCCFFLCFIASDFGVNLITNSQLNSWLKFAWTDLRQFPICLCYILWGMIFRRHSKNFKYTPDGPNIRVFGTMGLNHTTPPTHPSPWGYRSSDLFDLHLH